MDSGLSTYPLALEQNIGSIPQMLGAVIGGIIQSRKYPDRSLLRNLESQNPDAHQPENH